MPPRGGGAGTANATALAPPWVDRMVVGLTNTLNQQTNPQANQVAWGVPVAVGIGLFLLGRGCESMDKSQRLDESQAARERGLDQREKELKQALERTRAQGYREGVRDAARHGGGGGTTVIKQQIVYPSFLRMDFRK